MFAADPELGNLFLYQAVLRVRVDLYRAGEARSDMQSIRGFLDFLSLQFPFGGTTERFSIKEGIEVASLLLLRNNNPAADAKLNSLSAAIDKIVTRETAGRVSRGWKIHYQGKGVWQVETSGYRATGVGLLRKEQTASKVQTVAVLSMLQHVIDSISEESAKNVLFTAELEIIKSSFPEYWDKLFEISLKFSEYDALKKGKAGIEMEGALELARVGSDQAIRLARDLISLSQKDIELRQAELAAQKERFVRLKVETEEKIEKELVRFAWQIAALLSNAGLLQDPAAAQVIEGKLGAYLGTFLQGEMREEWLARAKSRVVGLKNGFFRIKFILREKENCIRLVRELAREYTARKDAIWRDRSIRKSDKGKAYAELKAEILAAVKEKLDEIMRKNVMIKESLSKGAKHILEIERICGQKAGKDFDEVDFERKLGELLSRIDLLGQKAIEAFDVDGHSLGRALPEDAREMELRFTQAS